jgi:ribosomal protein S18 acetylase RimI-like enzyme
VTGALSPGEADAFLGAGFAVIECLNLLAHDLHSIPEGPRTALQRVGPHRQAEVLRLDALSFPPFWQLDTAGLHEALTATAHSRFRMVAAGGAPIAYAIVGRAGRRGYLQRLAVHPDSRRAGLATALVVDGLRWARRWGVHRVVVNTQVDNTAALALYEALGFRVQPGGLSVLAAAVPTPA